MNRIFDSARRTLGLPRVKYRKREVSFKIKAMGLTGMQVTGFQREDISNAVSDMVKIWHKADSLKVVLMISASKGIQIKDQKGNPLFTYKIHNVANCTVDYTDPEIFLFIAKQLDNTIVCHAFYCNDQFQAEAICLSMSNAFHKAFEAWLEHKKTPSSHVSESNGHKDGAFLSDDETNSQSDTGRNDNKGALKYGAPAKRNAENGRRPSTLSEGSTFSFGSQADEAFTTLLSVAEEEDDDSRSLSKPSLLQRNSYDWGAAEKNEKVLSLLDGEEIVWEDEMCHC